MSKPNPNNNNKKAKLICSYGGNIQPAPNGNKLMYSGGDNKILMVDRHIKFSELVEKLSSVCGFRHPDGGGEVSVKYQLPGEDLGVLVSLTNDDDLDNMMFEYDRIHRVLSPVKTVRIRLFINLKLAAANQSSSSGSGTLSIPDYLFGFDKELDYKKVKDHELEHWKIPHTVDHPQNVKNSESDVKIIGGNGKENGYVAIDSTQERDFDCN